jgi:hypothetical protein
VDDNTSNLVAKITMPLHTTLSLDLFGSAICSIKIFTTSKAMKTLNSGWLSVLFFKLASAVNLVTVWTEYMLKVHQQ